MNDDGQESPWFQATLERHLALCPPPDPALPMEAFWRWRDSRRERRLMVDQATQPFRVGSLYRTRQGRAVRIVEECQGAYSRMVLGSDGLWRHDKLERGWISCAPRMHPYCLIPVEVEGD